MPVVQQRFAAASGRRCALHRLGLLMALCLAVSVVSPVTVDRTQATDEPPPVQLDGRRVVTVRSPDGRLVRLTSIPRSSFFWTFRRTERTCTFTTTAESTRLSDGRTVPRGTSVTSHYQFVEGVAAVFPLPPAELPADVLPGGSRGPLSSAVRTFTVYCDRTYYSANFVGFVSVVTTDTLLDPRHRRDDLRNALSLRRPVIVDPAVVVRRGGLVVRHPSWFAIGPDAWTTQRSNEELYRGLVIALIATPRRLDFEVEFRPRRPGAPVERFLLPCIPTVRARPGGAALPGAPQLADRATPGRAPCAWTPAERGIVTVRARVTYRVVFWASGWTEPDDDYVWESLAVSYPVGELTTPNTLWPLAGQNR